MEAGVLTPISYQRRWNVVDFLGKYHLSRFENKTLPLPGTQIKIERDHLQAKANDLKRFEDGVRSRSEHRQHWNKIKIQMVEFSTKVFFDTVVGTQVTATEDVLDTKEKILCDDEEMPDSPESIELFMNNVMKGKYHYVAHAIRAGFKSINYREPNDGNSALHLASLLGYPRCVEELMIYRANPDCKNILGEFPVHFAWRFWKNHKYRTKEEREAQEQCTCDILHNLFSYGAFVDARDQDNQTALHLACAKGPLKAVKLILFFRADPSLVTKQGLTPLQIAEKHKRTDIANLVSIFLNINRSIVHSDFSVLWQKFLHDYEASISTSQPAEKIIFEIGMSAKLETLNRNLDCELSVDDDLLRETYRESLHSRSAVRPWESEWKPFVREYLEESGQVKPSHRRLSVSQSQSKREVTPARRLPAMQPLPPRTPLCTMRENKASTELPSDVVQDEDDKGLVNLNASGAAWDSFFAVPEKSVEIRPSSELRQRRLACARAVCLDGKFQASTRRPSTSSKMFISHRNPDAALEGTEEEFSQLRAITSQGEEYDDYNKAKLMESQDVFKSPPKLTLTVLGEYNNQQRSIRRDPREQLFNKLVNKPTKFVSVSAATSVTPTQANLPTFSDEIRRKQIDMVNGRRARFVSADLLPPAKLTSVVDAMSKEWNEKQEKERLRKMGLSSEEGELRARAQVEQQLLSQGNLTSDDTLTGLDRPVTPKTRHFLDAPVVNFGKGRLTSTHNCKIPLEDPWSTVEGK